MIPDLQVGGVQRMMLQSILMARENGITTEVCCIKKRGDLAGEFEAAGIPVHVVSFASRLDPIALYKLRGLVTRGQYAIVHSHMYAAGMGANMALIGVRSTRIINSYHSQFPTSGKSQERMIRLTRQIPAAWIAVSDSVSDSLVRLGVPSDSIHVIHNGVPVPPEPSPIPSREKGESLELLWAGRFVKQKRLALIVEIIQRCKELGLPVHCTLLGDGPLYQPIDELVKAKGLGAWIALPGYSAEVNAWLRRCDLFLSASGREGFPNALLEACALGRGFIASDIPPHRELLGNSEAGYLAGDSIDDWLGILAFLTQDRRRVAQMGAKAHQLAKTYAIERSVSKLLALYDQVLKKNGDWNG